VESVHYCEKTGEERRQVYKDETSAVSEAASSFYPTRDLQGNPYSTEFGLSRYRDFQTIVIQEMPERAPPGQLPRSVEVILHDDLVDRAKPGDRLRVYGIYRALPKTNAGQKHTKAVFRTALLANCVKMLNKEIHGPVLTEEDIQNIKKISTKKGVFDLMAKSLAPSIYGHEYMKKSVLLQLLGGVEKNLENGTHIRG
jgi:DNA replication licensing factor MCM3